MNDDAPNTHRPNAMDPQEEQFRTVRGALENLVVEIRAAAGVRNSLGLKVNVALNVAERALRRYPAPDDG